MSVPASRSTGSAGVEDDEVDAEYGFGEFTDGVVGEASAEGWKHPRPNDLDRRPSMVAQGAPPRGSVLDYPSRLSVYRRYFVT